MRCAIHKRHAYIRSSLDPNLIQTPLNEQRSKMIVIRSRQDSSSQTNQILP